NDKLFQAIVADFTTNMDWNGLVKELLASPITTNATQTTTYATNGEVIAVSRRDHLCAKVNSRLGFDDICQLDAANQTGAKSTIAQIVSGMPSDGYGRGGVIPVLPNQPTLFYRGGLENICEQLSLQVIDAKVNAKQPNAKIWTSTAANVAGDISDFAHIIMGLTSSDDRTQPVIDALTGEFTTATANGATATDAMRSTFVTACLAPTFIGIGM
ncbi:MAG: hypothetical protein ABI704_25000, partial [Kofleriaceae bacterium]